MPALVPAAADLTFDFIACWLVAGLIAVVLLTGWITRTRAVVWVAILLLAPSALLLGSWLAYRFEELEGPITYEVTVVRLIAGVATLLLILSVWALLKMRHIVPPRPAGPTAASPPAPQVDKYDRDWILSLLQRRVAASREKVAKPPAPSTGPLVPPADSEASNSHP